MRRPMIVALFLSGGLAVAGCTSSAADGSASPTTSSWTVTFASNGGTPVASQSVAAGGKVNRPADPTRTGYTFAGWYAEQALQRAWDFSADTVHADRTLYASWTAIAAEGLVVSVPLQLDRSSLASGASVTGTVTYRNASSTAITVQDLVITARPPGATHSGGPYYDFSPAAGAITIAAGATRQLTATRAITSATAGRWEVYSTYQDGSGWHDGPSVYFTLAAPPPAPTHLVATAAAGQIALGWSASAGATSYTVKRSGSAGGPYATLATVSAPGTSYTNSGLSAGATYYYVVTASDGLESGSSNEASATTPGGASSFVHPPPGSKLFMGTNFWNEGWQPASDYFASSVDWTTTTDPWNPTFLAEVSAYAHVLRFMDWNRTNDQVDGAWSARARPNAAPGSRGVAYEWQIDLCNRVKADCWINVVTLADDDHVTRLAQLIKDRLDPSLRVYVEYSNEVWNGGFPQAGYVDDQGVAMNIMGDNQWYKGWAWYVYRAVRIFEGFEAVFGKDSPRLVKVLAGQAGYEGGAQNPAPICAWHLKALADATVNPRGTKVNAYAIAPYVGGTTVSGLTSNLASTLQWVRNHAACLSGTGIALIAYEGGQDSFAAGDCTAVQQSSGMYPLYQDFLNGMAASGMKGPFNHYTHNGHCWGLKVATGDASSASPKYRSVLDWAAANR